MKFHGPPLTPGQAPSKLFLSGYPPQDLLEKEWFVDRAEDALDRVADLSREDPGTAILVGTILRREAPTGKKLWNAAVLLREADPSLAAVPGNGHHRQYALRVAKSAVQRQLTEKD